MIPAGDDMKYKLIVSDLDGTLLNGQKFVSNINKEAIRKAKEPVSYTHLTLPTTPYV